MGIIVMAKMWEEMTQAEKIEDLRKDMKATMATLNAWMDQTRRLGEFHNDLMKKVSEVSKVVEALTAHPKKA
jgi:hypothetical protein